VRDPGTLSRAGPEIDAAFSEDAGGPLRDREQQAEGVTKGESTGAVSRSRVLGP